jgi:MFS family permease
VPPRPSQFPRAVYAALALVVLLAVVALASRGHAPPAGGGGQTRAPVQILFDIVFTLGLVAGIAMIVLIAFVRAAATERQRTVNFRSIVIIAIGAAVFMIAAVSYGQYMSDRGRGLGGAAGASLSGTRDTAVERAKDPQFQWPFALGTVALLVAALAVMILRERRRRRTQATERAIAARLADELDETLDDLRAEPDARRAVIAAYARMERALALHGLPRREAEAPLEYLARVLRELRASEKAISELTDLFAEAKFSEHSINQSMKERAISALVAVRDDLRAVHAEDRPALKQVPPEFEAAR